MLASITTCISALTLACAAAVNQVTRPNAAVRASLIVVQPWHKIPIRSCLLRSCYTLEQAVTMSPTCRNSFHLEQQSNHPIACWVLLGTRAGVT